MVPCQYPTYFVHSYASGEKSTLGLEVVIGLRKCTRNNKGQLGLVWLLNCVINLLKINQCVHRGRIHISQLKRSICPPQPAKRSFSLPLGCHRMRPSTIYTVCPILESVAYHHNRSHCKGIPPNAICIALSSIGSRVPATEPWW